LGRLLDRFAFSMHHAMTHFGGTACAPLDA
jgi:hypothetical protein